MYPSSASSASASCAAPLPHWQADRALVTVHKIVRVVDASVMCVWYTEEALSPGICPTSTRHLPEAGMPLLLCDAQMYACDTDSSLQPTLSGMLRRRCAQACGSSSLLKLLPKLAGCSGESGAFRNDDSRSTGSARTSSSCVRECNQLQPGTCILSKSVLAPDGK